MSLKQNNLDKNKEGEFEVRKKFEARLDNNWK